MNCLHVISGIGTFHTVQPEKPFSNLDPTKQLTDFQCLSCHHIYAKTLMSRSCKHILCLSCYEQLKTNPPQCPQCKAPNIKLTKLDERSLAVFENGISRCKIIHRKSADQIIINANKHNDYFKDDEDAARTRTAPFVTADKRQENATVHSLRLANIAKRTSETEVLPVKNKQLPAENPDTASPPRKKQATNEDSGVGLDDPRLKGVGKLTPATGLALINKLALGVQSYYRGKCDHATMMANSDRDRLLFDEIIRLSGIKRFKDEVHGTTLSTCVAYDRLYWETCVFHRKEGAEELWSGGDSQEQAERFHEYMFAGLVDHGRMSMKEIRKRADRYFDKRGSRR